MMSLIKTCCLQCGKMHWLDEAHICSVFNFEDDMVSNGFTSQDNILHKNGKYTIYVIESENTTFIFRNMRYKKSKANADSLLQIIKLLEGME